MSGPKLTVARELSIRDFYKQKVLLALPTENVSARPIYFSSKQDFIAKFLKSRSPRTSDFKVTYCFIKFLNFRDDRTKGCEDNPNLYVTYGLELFREFEEIRADGTCSHDDLVADMVRLREQFLSNRELTPGSSSAVSSNLVQVGDLVEERASNYIIGREPVIGSWFNFTSFMEINSDGE